MPRLLRGQLSGCSTELLVHFLTPLGRSLEIAESLLRAHADKGNPTRSRFRTINRAPQVACATI
jgi:hypothetical protein